ncbi:MAG: YceI family protein [Flavobacteriales bacterium]|nr:YceI family protein [Flavobacteriales bacterium]
MKKHTSFIKSLTIFIVGILISFSSFAGYDVYQVDTKSCSINWVGAKITGSSHSGTISVKSGMLYVIEGKIGGGDIVLDMTSLETTDMDASGNAKLTKHLKNEDFFSVDKFPEAKLEITASTEVLNNLDTDPNFEFTAKLTIKGITQEIKFGAIVSLDGKTITATAEIVFDRTKFDIKYGSGSFFDDLGDKVIIDDIKLKVNLTATLP